MSRYQNYSKKMSWIRVLLVLHAITPIFSYTGLELAQPSSLRKFSSVCKLQRANLLDVLAWRPKHAAFRMSLSTSDIDSEQIYKQTLIPIWRDLDDRLYEAPYGSSDMIPADSQGSRFFSLLIRPNQTIKKAILADALRARIEVRQSVAAIL